MPKSNVTNDEIISDEETDVSPVEGESVAQDEGTNEGVVSDNGEGVATESKSEVSGEKEAERLEHQKKVYDGMITSYVTKIVMGKPNAQGKAFSLLDIRDEKMREVVSEKLSSVRAVEGIPPTGEEKIISVLMRKLEMNILFERLDEVERVSATSEYDGFLKNGNTHEDALKKTRQLFGLLTKEEQRSFGQRMPKVGSAPTVEDRLTEEDEWIIADMKKSGINLNVQTYLKNKRAGLL